MWHNILHEKDLEIFMSLSKAAFFVLQANIIMKTGRYIKKKSRFINLNIEQDRKNFKKMYIGY